MSLNTMYLIILAFGFFSTITSISTTSPETLPVGECLGSSIATVTGPGIKSTDPGVKGTPPPIKATFRFRTFATKQGETTLVTYLVEGLEPGKTYPYHIHEHAVSGGDCATAGDHFNPTKSTMVGKCTKSIRPRCETGDLAGKYGKLESNAKGVAQNRYVDSSFNYKDIKDKAIVIHQSEIPKDSKPPARIACGTIALRKTC